MNPTMFAIMMIPLASLSVANVVSSVAATSIKYVAKKSIHIIVPAVTQLCVNKDRISEVIVETEELLPAIN